MMKRQEAIHDSCCSGADIRHHELSSDRIQVSSAELVCRIPSTRPIRAEVA
jgi:hypothetical protein